MPCPSSESWPRSEVRPTPWLAPETPDLVWFRGSDAVRFLNDLISQEIGALDPGRVRRSLLLGPQGKLDHMLWALRGEETAVRQQFIAGSADQGREAGAFKVAREVWAAGRAVLAAGAAFALRWDAALGLRQRKSQRTQSPACGPSGMTKAGRTTQRSRRRPRCWFFGVQRFSARPPLLSCVLRFHEVCDDSMHVVGSDSTGLRDAAGFRAAGRWGEVARGAGQGRSGDDG